MRRDDAVAIGMAAVHALCFIAIKTGLANAPPLAFGGLRALIGGVALLGLTTPAAVAAHFESRWCLSKYAYKHMASKRCKMMSRPTILDNK